MYWSAKVTRCRTAGDPGVSWDESASPPAASHTAAHDKTEGTGMTNEERKAAYLRQTGRNDLTGRQRRRIAKKAGQGKG